MDMEVDSFRSLATQAADILDKDFFFIVGAQKSGTTWLQRLLDAHPNILCSGEGHFVDRFAIPLANHLREYNGFMNLIAERVYENKPFYKGVTQDQFKFLVQSLTAFMFSQRDIDNNIKFIGDKTCAHVLYLPMLLEIFPNAKVLHLIRDGRDVVVSMVVHAQRVLKLQNSDVKWNIDNKVAELGKKWGHYIQNGQQFGLKHPDAYHELRFEDLKQNTDDTLSKVLKFLGAKTTKKIIQQCVDETSFEKLSGGRKEGEEDQTSFLRKGIVGDWRNHFSEANKDAFSQQTGELLSKLGYEK